MAEDWMLRTGGQIKTVVAINVEHSNLNGRQLPMSRNAAYSVYRYIEIETDSKIFRSTVATPEN